MCKSQTNFPPPVSPTNMQKFESQIIPSAGELWGTGSHKGKMNSTSVWRGPCRAEGTPCPSCVSPTPSGDSHPGPYRQGTDKGAEKRQPQPALPIGQL